MALNARETFEILVRDNADMLRAFLLALVKERELADELFQETFVTAWKKIDTYDPESPFGVWVRRIAGTLAMSRKRRVASGRLFYFDEETLALLEVQFRKSSRSRGDKWDEKLHALKQCLDALPKPALDVISLHYHKNHNCREIGNRLNLDIKQAKKRLQGTRKILYDCVQSKLSREG